MLYDVFLYTRNHNSDYNWIIKPEYIPADFSRIIQTFIDVNREVLFTENDWKRLVFFMKIKNVNIAMRFLRNGEDYVGRPIWSIEGISSLDRGHRSVLGMPDVVNYFYGLSNSFADMNNFGNLKNSIDIIDYINPLMGYEEYEEEEYIKEKQLNKTEFMKMIIDCKDLRVNFNCIVGENSERLFPYLKLINNISYYYDFNKQDYVLEVKKKTNIISSKDVIYSETEKHNRKLRIRFVKGSGIGGYYYEWIVEDVDANFIVGRSKIKFSDKVSLWRIIGEKRKLENYYYLTGNRKGGMLL